ESQKATPPCAEHAPRRSSFGQYSPSLQRAVMFVGALPNHLATPPWLEQAPCCDSALDQVLSPQRAVAFVGMRISFFAFAAFAFAAAFCALSVEGALMATNPTPAATSI